MPPITQYGSFTKAIADQINQNISAAGIGFLNGNVILLDPFKGSDNNDGITAPVHTLGRAYGIGREGKNDVIALISNGVTTSTARVSSTFTWAKNALHLVGVSSGVNISNRSRIAPTAAATAYANFFVVSGSGCQFNNIQFFHGFDTGTTSAIAMKVTGGRNMFANCHIAGMGDTASAQSSASRSLVISGTGENMFVNTWIGLDTVSSNTTNAQIEFLAGTPRNQFIDCKVLRYTSSAGSLFIVGAAAACMDREQLFERTLFLNAIKSGSTTLTAGITLAASTGGMILLKDSTILGATDWCSDATTFGQVYIDGAAPTTTTSGIAVVTS
jgi:hypothetical protein